MPSFRAWCFTLNHYGDSDENNLKELFATEQFAYAVYGREIGETGTPHLQGYCYLGKPARRTFESVRDEFIAALGHSRLHLESARAGPKKNIEYCTKSDTSPFICGIEPQVGKRKDVEVLNHIIEEIETKKGKTHHFDLIDGENTMVVLKYDRSLERLLSHMQRKHAVANRDIQVTLLLGDPGSGKSRWVSDNLPRDECYWVTYTDGDRQWYDGYNQHDILVLDDFKGRLKYQHFLRLLDRYPIMLETKGGTKPGVFTKVYITSIRKPEDWYNYSEGCRNIAEVNRRIHRTRRFPLTDLETWLDPSTVRGILNVTSDVVPETQNNRYADMSVSDSA